MDQFDRATVIEERDRADAQARRKPEGPKATGACLFCREPLADHDLPPEQRALRWCDPDCRDDWQREQPR